MGRISEVGGNTKRAAVAGAVVSILAAAVSVWGGSAQAAATIQFEPLAAPQRIADTRADGDTVDEQFERQGPIRSGKVMQLQIGGRAGVADDAAAATINVTAAGAAGPGYLTVYPCDEDRPNSSNVNYFAGTVRSNGVFAALDGQGRACIYALTTVDVIVDVNGWLPDGVFDPLPAPQRIADTRTNGETVDGASEGGGAVGAGKVLTVGVAGRAGIDADAATAVLNVTVTDPSGPGYVTVYPCDVTRPVASNLNYAAGDVTANSVVAKLDEQGRICLYTLASANLIVDVSGSLAGDYFTGLPSPKRLVDSRAGNDTVDGDVEGDGFRRAGTTLQFPVVGRAGIPAEATAVALNVTAVGAASPGYLTLHPRNSNRPNASNVNYYGGGVYANTVVAAVGGGGDICLFASSDVDVVVDVAGYFIGDAPVDTDVRCPLEFPLRPLWNGYPVGEYHMPAGLYVSENPPPDDVWCETRRLEEYVFPPTTNPLLGIGVTVGRYHFAQVRATDSSVDFTTVVGSDSVGRCDPLVPYEPPANPSPASSFGSGDWMVGVHIQPGTYSSSRRPDMGFCVVLVVSSWDGADSSTIARYQSGADDSITITVPPTAEGIRVSNTCETFR